MVNFNDTFKNEPSFKINDISKNNLNIDEMYGLIGTIDKALEPIKYAKTHVKASEFYNEYALLFTDKIKEVDPEIGLDLAAKWESRIDKFKPINIVDDSTNEVLYTLPAMYNQCMLLNDYKGVVKDLVLGADVDPTALPMMFNNIISRSDSAKKRNEITQQITDVTVQNQITTLREQVKLNDEIFEDLKKKKYKPEIHDKSNEKNEKEIPSSNIDTSEADIEWE
jgi:hypothetical protein